MVPTQISCRLFSPKGFFPAGFFWPPSDSSSCVNCRSTLSLVLRLILRSCNRLWYNVLLLLLVLGLNCQNKPNGFSSCCVLRGGAEIRFCFRRERGGSTSTNARTHVSYDPHSYERNLCNCVCRSQKNSGLQRDLNP